MQLNEFIADLTSRKGRGRPGTFGAQFESIMGDAAFVRHDFDTTQDLGRFVSNLRNHKAAGKIGNVSVTQRKTSVYLVNEARLTDEERATLVAAGVIG